VRQRGRSLPSAHRPPLVPVCWLRPGLPLPHRSQHHRQDPRAHSAFRPGRLGKEGAAVSQLSIESLKQMGAFTGAPVEKEISWKQGDQELTATVYVRPLSYLSAKSDLMAIGGKTDVLAGRIASSICDAEGKPIVTPEDITGEADPDRGALDGNLTVELLRVIGEVNGMGKPTS